jgi:transposase
MVVSVPVKTTVFPATGLSPTCGGFTTKIHTACDALGNPVRFILSGGQESDYTQALPLIDGFHVQAVLADKGYDSDAIIDHVAATGAVAVIPPRSNRKTPRQCDFILYIERHRIECFFSKIKHYRAIATRYCKRARNFLSLIYLAATAVWIR